MCSGTSGLLTHIQWFWPHRVMFWGICLRVSGGSTWNEFTLLGPRVPGMPDHPPLGAQVSLCDQSLKRFVRWESPISQSVIWSGPQVVGDSAEAVGSGRASTCASTLIPHAGGDLSWVGKSSAVAENVYFFFVIAPAYVHISALCRCPSTTHNNVQISLGKKETYIFFPWQKQNFLSFSHCNQKQNCARLEGL